MNEFDCCAMCVRFFFFNFFFGIAGAWKYKSKQVFSYNFSSNYYFVRSVAYASNFSLWILSRNDLLIFVWKMT